MTNVAELQKQSRIRELRKIIRHHKILYYNGFPQVTDETFDAFVDELRDLDPQDPVLFEVGAPPPGDSKWIKGKHKIPMGSQNKVNTAAELDEWAAKVGSNLEFTIQEKLDGLSVSLDYEGGKLLQALTRGDGVTGEDITRNIVRSQGVIRELQGGETCSLRGETMLIGSDFDRYNVEAVKKGWSEVSNARNGASGISRRLDGTGAEYLTVVFFDVAGIDFPSESEKLSWLKKQGMTIPLSLVGPPESVKDLFKQFEEGLRDTRGYEIDGMIVKVNQKSDAEAAESRLDSGSHSDRNPKSQVAWKFSDETRVTVLERVEWQTGKSGRITPVAILQPVQIGGVVVKRASLHNWSNIQSLRLSLGCQVLVKRANEVIPQVIESLDATPYKVGYVDSCPTCGASTEWDGEYLTCPNFQCRARLVGNVRKWIEYLDVDYFGESLIEKLVDAGKLSTVADLYRLSEEDITSLDGIGTRGAKRALRNLHSKRQIPLYLLFGSLNVPGFGRSLTKYIIEAGHDTPDKILSVTVQELMLVPKFGDGRAYFVRNALTRVEPLVRELMTFLEIQLPGAQNVQPTSSGTLSGKSFCFTGKLSKGRKDWESDIKAIGGEIKSVSSKLDYLVCADPNSGSSKLKKAAKLGVQVISESQLLEMM